MLTKKLMIPARIAIRPKLAMRGEIRLWFEKHHPGSEIIRMHFLENRCFVQIDEPILEYSSYNRLQYHLEGKATEYDLVPSNRAEIVER
jgi:hypothetical protein